MLKSAAMIWLWIKNNLLNGSLFNPHSSSSNQRSSAANSPVPFHPTSSSSSGSSSSAPHYRHASPSANQSNSRTFFFHRSHAFSLNRSSDRPERPASVPPSVPPRPNLSASSQLHLSSSSSCATTSSHASTVTLKATSSQKSILDSSGHTSRSQSIRTVQQAVQTDPIGSSSLTCACPAQHHIDSKSVAGHVHAHAPIVASATGPDSTATGNTMVGAPHRASIACVSIDCVPIISCKSSASTSSRSSSVCESNDGSGINPVKCKSHSLVDTSNRPLIALPVSNSYTGISSHSKVGPGGNVGISISAHGAAHDRQTLSPLTSPHGFRSGYQQLQVCGLFGIRHQYKRSSYPSGLKVGTLRIGPRLSKDKSCSRLAFAVSHFLVSDRFV